jgi:hypothetical protein
MRPHLNCAYARDSVSAGPMHPTLHCLWQSMHCVVATKVRAGHVATHVEAKAVELRYSKFLYAAVQDESKQLCRQACGSAP